MAEAQEKGKPNGLTCPSNLCPCAKRLETVVNASAGFYSFFLIKVRHKTVCPEKSAQLLLLSLISGHMAGKEEVLSQELSFRRGQFSETMSYRGSTMVTGSRAVLVSPPDAYWDVSAALWLLI